MVDVSKPRDQRLTTRRSQPLIAIPILESGEEVVHYFNSQEAADQAVARDSTRGERALRLAGAWAHIDAEDGPDMLDELDRMRHESKPTPPLDL